jgi:hypothetical protein
VEDEKARPIADSRVDVIEQDFVAVRRLERLAPERHEPPAPQQRPERELDMRISQPERRVVVLSFHRVAILVRRAIA